MAPVRVNSALIRRINTARVFHALREHPGISQRGLSALVRLDAATISTIVARLEAEAILRRDERANPGRRGRPERALSIAPEGGLLIGASIEVGVIRLIATGLDGAVRGRLELPGEASPAAALAALADGAAALLGGSGVAAERLRGVGVGVPGLIDTAGRLVLAPNLGWRDLPIAAMLAEAVPGPVQVGNDTNVAALAERLFGVCRGRDDFLYINSHSGIGGALHLQGGLYYGAGGLAGELGHMKIVPGGRPCGCGGRGCLEAYVSGPAILARLAEAGRTLQDTDAVADAAAAGDPVVLDLLADSGRLLGFALASLVNLLNPRLVVLGGGLARLADFLLPALRRTLAEDVLAVMALGELLVSPLGEDAVPLGGVALAMDAFLPVTAGLTA